jgi:cytidylate kinase
MPFVVAIDGPAASGKSSTAQWVARELGWRHVDSGAFYRAATAAMLRTDMPSDSWTDAAVLRAAASVGRRDAGTSVAPTLDGEPCEDAIRGTAVTGHVSLVARMTAVRAWVNDHVRAAARDHHVVVDGRDMGTAVFPEATIKIFLVADPWERARRRLVQRLGRSPTEDEIAAETEALVKRDAADATQTVQAADAILIDTTYLTQLEQVDRIVALARAASGRAR